MELLDICDENGIPTGETVERKMAHEKGIGHRTAHIWIVRLQDGIPQVLLQKRALNKDSFPGRFDTSCAGHIQAGDEPVTSALRELEEELGIYAGEEDLEPAGKFHVEYDKEFNGKMFKDRETAFVYIYTKELEEHKLILQEEEISEVAWFSVEELAAALEVHDQTFCVPRTGFAIVRDWLESKKICPCCRTNFISEKYEICSLCGWEYDPVQNKDPELTGGANKLSLNQEREQWNNKKVQEAGKDEE